ncbi:lipopolysaccharide export system protein LptC [Palleronia aestuarii]|uniref:Lipopolysaccharide export system protein LptC n=1 Tax=Palleronia aestuarii TaxID=568105 RepID=A0A2W7NRE6_9RHOB|nr:LPS export ABC transporter periplasmic protein LptC [Palleronia aestuarii]PZX15826.1 lipopolysaccharide export system protein LptC [Palleronia aestuarii]
MATFDNRHSRQVALLKVALPLIALAILSTLFLLADRRGSGDRIPYSQLELDRIVAEQRISNPNYSGVTPEGDAVTLASGSVRPDPESPEEMIASDLIGTIETPKGERILLSAETGSFRSGSDVNLTGDVRLRSSAGYRVESDGMVLDAETGTVSSDGAITAIVPPGRIDAAAMTLTRGADGFVLRFTGGTKLLYYPDAGKGD